MNGGKVGRSERSVNARSRPKVQNDVDRFQEIEPVSSGIWIAPRFNPSLIQSRNTCFVPCTSSGEQPRPTNERIAFLSLSSCMNHVAHSGTTGRPKRRATRFKTKSGSLLHRTLRAPSRSAPGRVFAISFDRATRWRSGLFLPGTATLPR